MADAKLDRNLRIREKGALAIALIVQGSSNAFDKVNAHHLVSKVTISGFARTGRQFGRWLVE